MKKIGLLLPFLFLIFGCVESELIIPGENVGGGDIPENPSNPNLILATYNYQTPNLSYELNYNETGQLTEFNASNLTISRNLTYQFTDNLISQITAVSDNQTQEDIFVYNDLNQLTEIHDNQNPDTKLVIEHDPMNITATLVINGNDDSTYSISKDAYGYIKNIEKTDLANGDVTTTEFTLNDNILLSNNVTTEGNEVASLNYTYDNKSNPLYLQTIIHFNEMVLYEIFNPLSLENKNLEIYPMLRSINNISSMSYDNGVPVDINYEYVYNDNNLPESAVLSTDSTPIGSTTYTYH